MEKQNADVWSLMNAVSRCESSEEDILWRTQSECGQGDRSRCGVLLRSHWLGLLEENSLTSSITVTWCHNRIALYLVTGSEKRAALLLLCLWRAWKHGYGVVLFIINTIYVLCACCRAYLCGRSFVCVPVCVRVCNIASVRACVRTSVRESVFVCACDVSFVVFRVIDICSFFISLSPTGAIWRNQENEILRDSARDQTWPTMRRTWWRKG